MSTSPGLEIARNPDDPMRPDMFRAALETSGIPVIITDAWHPDQPILFANRAFLALTGYDIDDIIGSNCRLLQGPATDQEAIGLIRRAVRERTVVSTELLNYRKDGSTFWNSLCISPVFDTLGEPIYLIGTLNDVTQRRQMEQAWSASTTMESLGRLAGGVAHDFSNLLQVMGGYLEILKARVQPQKFDADEVRAGFDHIRFALERASALTRLLLVHAHTHRMEERPLSLNDVVDRVIERIGLTSTARHALSSVLAADLVECRADASQAESALLFLVAHARDVATGHGGALVIETSNMTVGPDEIVVTGRMEPGLYACVAVTDTGGGVRPDAVPHVLAPFFPADADALNAGLGATMVYSFIRQAGGSIRIETQPGGGTTVRLMFRAAVEIAHATMPARSPRGGTRDIVTILVVEDRVEVAELARAMLEHLDYDVVMADSGANALALLQVRNDIDLLFSDVLMPGGMSGVELAREASRQWPGLKVLLSTAYADISRAGPYSGDIEFDIIQKPYRRAELSSAIRKILEAPSTVAPPGRP